MEQLRGVPTFILGRVCENFVLILYEMFAGTYQLLKMETKLTISIICIHTLLSFFLTSIYHCLMLFYWPIFYIFLSLCNIKSMKTGNFLIHD